MKWIAQALTAGSKTVPVFGGDAQQLAAARALPQLDFPLNTSSVEQKRLDDLLLPPLGEEAQTQLAQFAQQAACASSPSSASAPLWPVLLAWAWVLARFGRQQEFLLALVINQAAALSIRLPQEDQTALDWLQQMQAQLQNGLLPLSDVLPSSNPAFTSSPESVPSIRVALSTDAVAAQDFSLTLLLETLETSPGSVNMRLLYAPALLARPLVQQIAHSLHVCLLSLLADPQQLVHSLPLLSVSARNAQLQAFNRSHSAYQRGAGLAQAVQEQARLRPQAVAVVDGEHALTYQELNARANQLARHLQALGVQGGQMLGLCLPRGTEMVVAMLAILKAGGAYLPLDPDYPPVRRAFILEDSAARIVLTNSALQGEFAGQADLQYVLLDAGQNDAAWLANATDDLALSAHAGQELAYMIYTSGSTGQPKGVMVEQGNVLRLVQDPDYLQLGADSVVAQASNAAFDAATFEIWGALVNGARLEILPKEALLDSAQLPAILQQRGIDTLFLTTALFNRIAYTDPACFAGLQHLLFGGEAVNRGAVQAVLHAGPPRRLLHVYGPTENTTFSTWHEVTEHSLSQYGTYPIGAGLAGSRVYVLDAQQNLVPPGVVGELYLGGPGVARGYWQRAEMTQQRFLSDPFCSEPGARMYRSGDLVRWYADGQLEFIGRNDHQIKLRGFRIELGEIEAVLATHPDIHSCLLLQERGEVAEKRLFAYLTAKDPQTTADLSPLALQTWLAQRLPPYMLPHAFVLLPNWPLNPNGKIERNALPAPAAFDFPQQMQQGQALAGEAEQALAAAWREVLRLPPDFVLTRDSDWLLLGAHSLHASQLLARLRAQGYAGLNLAAIFQHTRLADFAAGLQAGTPASADFNSDTADLHGGSQPLAPAQQRLWFLQQLDGAANRAYHISFALDLHGICSMAQVAALQQAYSALVARHASLRTRFYSEAGIALQEVLPALTLVLQEYDLSQQDGENAAAHAQRVQAWQEQEQERPFALEQGGLLRLNLLHLAPQQHQLLVVIHHLIADGWSMQVFMQELAQEYAAALAGTASPLPALTVEYSDYCRWQMQQDGSAHLPFWRQHLQDAPALLELPLDQPRPPRQSWRGAQIKLELDAALCARLHGFARNQGYTPFMLLLSAWGLCLSRICNQEQVVVGVPLANRSQAEFENLIGFFVNTLALKLSLPAAQQLSALLQQVRADVLQALARAELPFEQVVEELRPQRSLSYNPLFQTMLALNNAFDVSQCQWPGWQTQVAALPRTTTQFDLMLVIDQVGTDQWQGQLVYATDLFSAESATRISRYFVRALQALLESDSRDQAIARVPLLDQAERLHLLQGMNQSARAYPQQVLLHELIAAQVARTPQACALCIVTEQRRQEMSYAQLNAAANRLARHLQSLGAGRDKLVAICTERSLEMVVGLLAILKAGAAYVPLDPSYPQERLAYMLEDSAPQVILSHRRIAPDVYQMLAASGHPLLDLQQDQEWAANDASDLSLQGQDERQLAYVIYTSGSTGKPKGVMNEQHGIVNRLLWMQEAYQLQADDVVLQKTTFSFDVSVWEFFWPLMVGAKLLLARPEGHKDPAYLAQLIQDEAVTTLHFVPSMLQVFLEQEAARACHSLRRVVTSGEALASSLAQRLRACLPQAALHNLYGPTEAAVDVTYWDQRGDAAMPAQIPIGKPVANTQIYLLDALLQPVPQGVAGEIHIAGVQVARGYLNRPELSAERFIDDPFAAAASSAKMYKTGDLGRYLPDGNIEYLGRNDHQIKLRGFRIELGEIEAAIAGHPAVREVLVMARTDFAEAMLVAYLVLHEGTEITDLETVMRAHLANHLPEHMLPAAWVCLAQMPLTPNGKADRKALPAPQMQRADNYQAPHSAIEIRLAQIWAELLKVERVGRFDNFFALGGHSLLAARLVAKIEQEYGISFALREVFNAAVLAQMEEKIVLALAQNLADSQEDELEAMLAALENLSDEQAAAQLDAV